MIDGRLLRPTGGMPLLLVFCTPHNRCVGWLEYHITSIYYVNKTTYLVLGTIPSNSRRMTVVETFALYFPLLVFSSSRGNCLSPNIYFSNVLLQHVTVFKMTACQLPVRVSVFHRSVFSSLTVIGMSARMGHVCGSLCIFVRYSSVCDFNKSSP